MAMDATKALGLQGLMQKTLSDMVRGIRSHKKDEAQYISQCIQEIKDELKSPKIEIKTVAVQKVSYLKMIGYDMSWAAFPVVEVMASSKFTTKRVGYLAASSFFHDGIDVTIMTTNLIRKDIAGANQYEAGMALNCLANMCTPDLARDLAADVVAILNTSRPYVRKRAVLALYKIFLRFPDALRPAFPRLKEKLEDQDQAVVSSAVNVICELARKNPANYLPLAPLFFKIMTTCTNNWMLIKVVKLFGALCPLEPRLVKKLAEPLSGMINTTPAMSLLYEVIQTCCTGLAENVNVIKLCLSRLRAFIEDPDQNLKYLGLVALCEIMKAHPKAVADYRDLVLWCLEDEDQTIRSRALHLLSGMVTKKNLPEIVAKLMTHLPKAEAGYRDDLVERIVSICSQNFYQFISDFEWYIDVLVQLSHVTGTSHGALLSAQFLDVMIRVKPIRPIGLKHMVTLLNDQTLLNLPAGASLCEVLYAAAWLVGEYAAQLETPKDLLAVLLQPRALALPGHVQAVFVHNVLKIVALLLTTNLPHFEESLPLLKQRLAAFTTSVHLEVQERACFALQLVSLLDEARADGSLAALAPEVATLFAEPLNPVAKGIQAQIAPPAGLDLSKQLHAPLPVRANLLYDSSGVWAAEETSSPGATTVAAAAARGLAGANAGPKARRVVNDPNYLRLDVAQDRTGLLQEEPPIKSATELGLSPGELQIQQQPMPKPKKNKPKISAADIDRTTEAPPELLGSPSAKPAAAARPAADDPWGRIDLTSDLTAKDILPVRQHRVVVNSPGKQPVVPPVVAAAAAAAAAAAPAVEKKKKKKKKDEDAGAADGKKKKGTGKKKAAAAAAAAGPAAPAPAAAPTAAPGVPAAPARKPLASNGGVSVDYELKFSDGERQKVVVELTLSSLGAPITGIDVSMASTPNTRLLKVSKVAEPLTADQPKKQMLLLQFDSIAAVGRLPVALSYTVGTEARKLELPLTLPCSAFVRPVKVSPEEFMTAAQTPLSLASTALVASDLRETLRAIAGLLQVQLVEAMASAASLYGRTIQGHHVLLLVKAKPNQQLQVDLKASDPAVASALIAEINAAPFVRRA